MSRKRRVEENHESPIGFVMFGDLMSQLLCFFILLFIFATKYTSNSQEDMLKKISESFKKSVAEQKAQPKAKIEKAEPVKEERAEVKVAQELKQILNDEKLKEYADVIVEEQKVRIVLQQPVMFDPGKAELKKSAVEILTMIGQVLLKTKNPIDIEGHTDTDPIHTDKYDSNWDLSFDRAYTVIKFMVKNVGIPPLIIHAIGYGEYRPIAPNDTPEHKAKNRRIEINLYFKEGMQVRPAR